MNVDPKELALGMLNDLRRFPWTVVAGVSLGLAVAIVIVERSPKVYEATTTIYADAERLPEQFIRPTISDEVELRLTPLRQATLREGNVLEVVEEAFPEITGEAAIERTISEIRTKATFFYADREKEIEIKYADEDPRRAARIVSMLADFMIRENVLYRVDKASELRESIEGLAVRTEEELRAERAEIARIRSQYPFSLESQRANNELQVVRLREKLEEKRGEIADAVNRQRLFEATRPETRVLDGGSRPPATTPVDALSARIRSVESELETLRQEYGELHPEIQSRVRLLEELKQERAASGSDPVQPPARTPEPPAPGPTDVLDVGALRRAAVDALLNKLRDEERDLQREIARYERFLAQTPSIQAELDEHLARVDVLEKDFAQYQSNIEEAKKGERIEERELANPFQVIRPASPPLVPASPQVVPILGGGVLIGLLLFLGPLVVRHVLRPVILSETRLNVLTGVPVLARVSVIPTPDLAARSRRALLRNLALSLLSIVILVGVVAVVRADLL